MRVNYIMKNNELVASHYYYEKLLLYCGEIEYENLSKLWTYSTSQLYVENPITLCEPSSGCKTTEVSASYLHSEKL